MDILIAVVDLALPLLSYVAWKRGGGDSMYTKVYSFNKCKQNACIRAKMLYLV